MRFHVSLDKPYFAFAKAECFTFDNWHDDGISTLTIDLSEKQNKSEDEYFQNFILPAIHNFHKRCASINFNPTSDTRIGTVLYPAGTTFAILSRNVYVS